MITSILWMEITVALWLWILTSFRQLTFSYLPPLSPTLVALEKFEAPGSLRLSMLGLKNWMGNGRKRSSTRR